MGVRVSVDICADRSPARPVHVWPRTRGCHRPVAARRRCHFPLAVGCQPHD